MYYDEYRRRSNKSFREYFVYGGNWANRLMISLPFFGRDPATIVCIIMVLLSTREKKRKRKRLTQYKYICSSINIYGLLDIFFKIFIYNDMLPRIVYDSV